MRRLAALCAIVLLVGLAWQRAERASAQAPAPGDLLAVLSHVTYNVQPGAGGVHVDWDVELTDNDPATTFQYQGYFYYYISYGIPVLRGASNVIATGPGGGLTTELVERGDSTILFAKVTFDRELFYGDSYSFHLAYDLAEARADFDIVTPYYVYVPAIVVGDGSTARIVTPGGPDWQVSVQTGDCGGASEGQYRCGASQYVQTAALVEVIRAGAQASLEGSAHTKATALALTMNYFPGDEAWAGHVRDLAAQALPVLEELFGVPYYQPANVTISEGGQQELYGYAGRYSCPASPCNISISPAADDHTLVHELAHSWTEDFSTRWLEEGFAEHMARLAEQRLGVGLRDGDLPPEDVVTYPLDTWHSVTYFFGSDKEQRLREYSGYQRSRQLIELLEQTVGLAALQKANMAAHVKLHVDSKSYMDLIEEASGQSLDDVFLAWVFPPEDARLLQERRLARDRFSAFKQQITAAGLEVPDAIQRSIDAWSFTPANNMMDRAGAALFAYVAARHRVDAPRSRWQRFGLQGDDPGKTLVQAAASFKAGNYELATEQARTAVHLIDRAGRVALYRALVVAGMVALVAVVLALGLIAVRRRAR